MQTQERILRRLQARRLNTLLEEDQTILKNPSSISLNTKYQLIKPVRIPCTINQETRQKAFRTPNKNSSYLEIARTRRSSQVGDDAMSYSSVNVRSYLKRGVKA